MIVNINPRNIITNSVIIYNLIKLMEKEKDENFFINYTPVNYSGSFIKYLGKEKIVSMELIGKFSDKFGDFYVGFYNKEPNIIMDISKFEAFLCEESSLGFESIHNILLFHYSRYVIDKESELRKIFKESEFLKEEEQNAFDLNINNIPLEVIDGKIKKGISEKKQEIVDEILELTDNNKDVLNLLELFSDF